jgi:hypothetical protein
MKLTVRDYSPLWSVLVTLNYCVNMEGAQGPEDDCLVLKLYT